MNLYVYKKEQPDQSFLTKYITYARMNCSPIVGDEAQEGLVQNYVKMRSFGGKNTLTATARQLESMIRISEALAKMRLSGTVEK